jgi:hypothetical protein
MGELKLPIAKEDEIKLSMAMYKMVYKEGSIIEGGSDQVRTVEILSECIAIVKGFAFVIPRSTVAG